MKYPSLRSRVTAILKSLYPSSLSMGRIANKKGSRFIFKNSVLLAATGPAVQTVAWFQRNDAFAMHNFLKITFGRKLGESTKENPECITRSGSNTYCSVLSTCFPFGRKPCQATIKAAFCCGMLSGCPRRRSVVKCERRAASTVG